MRKLLLIGSIVSSIFGACGERDPESIVVVPHVVKSMDTVKRYNPVFHLFEDHYRYEFWDSDYSVILNSSSKLSIGDTIDVVYRK